MVKVEANIHIFFFLQLLLLASLMAVSEAQLPLRPIKHVHIMNSLGKNIILRVHCKSKDDDLGFHDVAFGTEYEFQFGPNIFGTTLFFCSMEWDGKFHSVTVYSAATDDKRCKKNCYWTVQQDKICTHGDAGNEDCFPWK